MYACRFFSFADAHAGNVLKAAAAATPASGAAVAVVASDSVEEVAPQEAVTGPLAAAAKAAREEAIKPLIEPVRALPLMCGCFALPDATGLVGLLPGVAGAGC